MAPAIYIVLGLIVLGASISLIWRISSHRYALPCPSWLGWMVELDNPFTRINRAQFIIEHLELAPAMKVLDAGCGPGRLSLSLAEAVGPQGEVLAMDIQDGVLAHVRVKVQASGLQNVQYLQAGLGEGKLPPDRNHTVTDTRHGRHIGRCCWAVIVSVVGYRLNLGESKWIEDLATTLFWG